MGSIAWWAVRRRFLKLRNNYKKKARRKPKILRDFSKLQSVKLKVEKKIILFISNKRTNFQLYDLEAKVQAKRFNFFEPESWHRPTNGNNSARSLRRLMHSIERAAATLCFLQYKPPWQVEQHVISPQLAWKQRAATHCNLPVFPKTDLKKNFNRGFDEMTSIVGAFVWILVAVLEVFDLGWFSSVAVVFAFGCAAWLWTCFRVSPRLLPRNLDHDLEEITFWKLHYGFSICFCFVFWLETCFGTFWISFLASLFETPCEIFVWNLLPLADSNIFEHWEAALIWDPFLKRFVGNFCVLSLSGTSTWGALEVSQAGSSNLN